ncbi:hypothetical protein TGFOU_359840 [Toxoplasma gondii FOU]|uniref:Secreted protein n=3 Tax=Toxoplasma gondii TaxID=5811 RepID=A0A086JZ99_TOXGO|nr:hypothetical protein TGFOU_359840 [Toxoplasma gondii FOU]PUA84955.1 hypothetical protein TGBR9_359840 [Toxoplasma gondii TgCATBr9]RQX68383.1 hypothetical protein TGCAST_359840 [Toxoplasma gondii CAST]
MQRSAATWLRVVSVCLFVHLFEQQLDAQLRGDGKKWKRLLSGKHACKQLLGCTDTVCLTSPFGSSVAARGRLTRPMPIHFFRRSLGEADRGGRQSATRCGEAKEKGGTCSV